MGREGLAFTTIKGYLSVVRNLQIRYSFASPFDTPMPKLNQILRGIKILRSKQCCVPNWKLPVTPTNILQVHTVWSKVGKEHNQTLIWVASTVCFFGFLSAEEIALRANKQFDPTSHLSFEDVATESCLNPTFIHLILKTSKTDPYMNGANIIIGSTGNDLCSMSALFSYLWMRGSNPGPQFLTEDGALLTCSGFVSQFRMALKRLDMMTLKFSNTQAIVSEQE